MKKQLYLLVSSLSVCLLVLLTSSTQKIDGPPVAVTGAPNEGLCTRCHSGANPNSGPASVNIKFGNNEANYEPGKTYEIEVNVNGSDKSNHGFQLVAKNANNQTVGTFRVTDNINTQLNPSNNAYIQHTRAGQVSRNSWKMEWTAPSTEAGPITFYVAVLAANGDTRNSGDLTYTYNKTITPKTVGNEEEILPSFFTIFPNPAKNKLFIKCLKEYGLNFIIRIWNMDGKLVQSTTLEKLAQTETIELKLDNLPPGLYGLEIQNEGKSYYQNIFIY
ncbi:MAG: choice-of-anchor V domain-containing protein [Bacteroidia bacterium]|nr:T9SS type A sorting domain-containing protein [Bacteroidia bacterium]MDW8158106.1 choice-of-anchor V domain-containing protein [Bacteroidia bacterium]